MDEICSRHLIPWLKPWLACIFTRESLFQNLSGGQDFVDPPKFTVRVLALAVITEIEQFRGPGVETGNGFRTPFPWLFVGLFDLPVACIISPSWASLERNSK